MATRKINGTIEFAPLVNTIEDLKAILSGSQQEFYHRKNRNADGTPQRWRKSGMLKTWKRDNDRIYQPFKHGLYLNGAIESLADFNEYMAVSYEIKTNE